MSERSTPIATPALQPPAVALAAARAEIEKLHERLSVSDEWNVRLQNQIQELLNLPCNEVDHMRERMRNPDIAIPLLQCYDATIQEKTEQNERLTRENTQLRARVEATNAEHNDMSNAVRVAEELAKHVQSRASAEVQQTKSTLDEVQTELGRVRQELTRALDAESTTKLETERTQKQLAALKTDLEKTRTELAASEEALVLARTKLNTRAAAEGESTAVSEVTKVQLSVLSKTNEDRLQDLEQLRTKMVQALRQASDNHAAHLRVVSERHRLAIEDLQNINRTQELEVLKLRAQLARVDPSNPAGSAQRYGGGSGANAHLKTTTELLDSQARMSQEAELKRLCAEVASLQVQRDDAVLRYEQLASTVRRDKDAQAQEARRESRRLQRRAEDCEARNAVLESEKLRLSQELHTMREKVQTLQLEIRGKELAAEEQQAEGKRLQAGEAESKRALLEAQESLRTAQQQHAHKLASMETQVSQALEEAKMARERCVTELQQATRQMSGLRREHQEAQRAITEAQAALHAAERERDALQTQLARLNEALSAHKRQIASYETRTTELEGRVEENARQQRSQALMMEQLKVENGRLARSRGDRFAEGLPSSVLF